MKKFLAFVSFVLFVSIFVSILPLSVFADESGNNVAPDIPDSSFYNMNEESVLTFSEEIPYDNINDSYHSQALLQNAQSSGNASTYATAISNTKVPNGVYAFKNLGNANRWMDVQQDMTVPGYHMQQYAFGSSPADTGTKSGLYIVKAVDSSRYTIRLLLNPSLTFYISGTEVLTKTIPLDDDDVALQDTFYIYRNGSGYTIRPYGSSYYICPNSTTASGMSGAPDSYLTRKSLSAAGNCARWSFEKYYDYVVDGIYAFKNVGNTNRWMDIEQDKDEEGYHMQQYAFGETSPAESFTRSGLFKVTQLDTSGKYVIRSMLNNLLSFNDEGDYIYTKEISHEDANNEASDMFYIVYDKTYGGYTLQPCGSSKYVSANNTQASGMSGAPASYLTTRTTKNANAVWEMEQVVGNQSWGGAIHFQYENYSGLSRLIAGKNTIMRVVTWSCDLKANQPYASINSSYSQYATSFWNSSNSSLLVMSHDAGDINADVSVKKNGNIIGTKQLPLTVTLPTPEGKSAIGKYDTDAFINLNIAAAPNYPSGTTLKTCNLIGRASELWILEHDVDGYYTIRSAESSMYLSVPTNYENTANVNIVQLPYSGLDTQIWKIDVTLHGMCVLYPKSGEIYSTDWCLALNSNNMICQKEYDYDSDYSDEWEIYRVNGSINLNVVYDGAYSTLCIQEHNTTAATRISGELQILRNKFLFNFGVVVNYNSPTQFISLPEKEDENGNRICSANYREACDCVNEDDYPCTDSIGGSVFEYHHTNMTNILHNYVVDYNDSLVNHFVIVYTGYEVCLDDDHDGLYGLARISLGLMGISNHSDESSQNIQETKTLVHELGHMFGAPDHYAGTEMSTNDINAEKGSSLYNRDCIYGEDKEDAAADLTICAGCRRDIEENANIYNHN